MTVALRHKLALAELEAARRERDEVCDRFKLATYRVQNAERAVKEAQTSMRRPR